jgi:PIN domain nuclease of toxin-antitoxin system
VNDVVLDASALMAVLRSEPGSDAVQVALPRAIVGAVNLSEVHAKLVEQGMPEAAAWSALSGLGLHVVAFDTALARVAGGLRATTRKLGLSFGDRACLALGQLLKLPVLTADRSWRQLNIGVEVRAVR